MVCLNEAFLVIGYIKLSTPIKLKALIFDVGDILYDASLWRKWLTSELNSNGIGISYEQLVEVWESFLVPVYKGNAEYWPQFQAMLSQLGNSDLDGKQLEAAAREKGKLLALQREPMPQVPETLKDLKDRGVCLAALSDNESGEQGIRKTLEQLGIEHCFDAVVSSCEIGHVKPEAKAFDYAIEKTGQAKANCGFVAHDIDELSGAQRHSLFAIGYNYHPAAPADCYIENFSELLEFV